MILSEQEQEQEAKAFEEAKESNRGTIIPIMVYETQDLIVESGGINFDEVVPPVVKEKIKIVEIKPGSNKNDVFKELF